MSPKYPEEMVGFKQKIEKMKDDGYDRYKSESGVLLQCKQEEAFYTDLPVSIC